MEKTSYKTLEYKHISEATDEIIQYIDNRRKGFDRSLKTRWDKFNDRCNGGFEPNCIYTIGGISGSGKSSFANSLETDLIDLNPDEEIVILNLSWEMLSQRQVGRKLSYKLTKTTQDLYSGNRYKRLSEEDFEKVKKVSESIKHYNIYYVDTPGTVDEVRNTIIQFYKQFKGKWIVIILDHTLLTKGKTGQGERQILADLQNLFIEVKKFGKNTIIQLSQLNRNIEEPSRITNPALHFPQRSDLFGSDSLYQASDVLMIIHRPEILGIEKYSMRELPVEDMIYLHILKVREGSPAILQFKNRLKYNSIEEVQEEGQSKIEF